MQSVPIRCPRMVRLACPLCGWSFTDDGSGVTPEHGDPHIGYLAMLCQGTDAPAIAPADYVPPRKPRPDFNMRVDYPERFMSGDVWSI